MAKFRWRETVEATRWFPGTKISGLTQIDTSTAVIDNREHPSSLALSEIHRDFITVNSGDYVVTYANGYRTVCGSDYFEKKYENVGG